MRYLLIILLTLAFASTETDVIKQAGELIKSASEELKSENKDLPKVIR